MFYKVKIFVHHPTVETISKDDCSVTFNGQMTEIVCMEKRSARSRKDR